MITEKKVFSQVWKNWYGEEVTVSITKDSENEYYLEFDESGDYELLDTTQTTHNLGDGIELTCFDNDGFELYDIEPNESVSTITDFITNIPQYWYRGNRVYMGLTQSDWHKMRKDFMRQELYIYDKLDFTEYVYNIDDLEVRNETIELADSMEKWTLCLSSANYDYFI